MDFQILLSNDIDKIPNDESLELFENEYKCLEIMGEGGFGRVQKAIQSCDQRSVAIKFIADKKVTSWYFYQNQQKYIPMEIALMCRCHDVPGVIKIIKYFKIKEHKGWYIVMERFENYVDLFDHITNQGHISEKTASYFMTQLLNIVINCHRLGVCHRDIKDENIVIDLETKKIYLIDFGAGGILNSGIYTEFDGTRVYSPPEWIQFKQYRAISLEVWSLGILLFDMVCGNLPFDNDESIVSCIFPYRRAISPNCQDLIQRCLQYDPDKRIDINAILNHQWFTQHSKANTIERRKRCSRVTSIETSHNFSTTCNNKSSLDLCSGRASVETSPFITPQSSGLEDNAYVSDKITDSADSYHQSITRSTLNDSEYKYLCTQKHNRSNIVNCHFELTNFR